MGNKLFTQVILIITSITIVVTYIQPSFADIADVQDDIARFEITVTSANELNQLLQQLVTTEKSFSRADMQALDTYLPRDIDDVLIMRDIQNMFKQVGLPITSLNSLASEGVQTQFGAGETRGRNAASDDAVNLRFKDLSLSFYGSYEHLRQILQSLEANAYPLEIIELNFAAAAEEEEGEENAGLQPGYMKYDMVLRAYALPGV